MRDELLKGAVVLILFRACQSCTSASVWLAAGVCCLQQPGLAGAAWGNGGQAIRPSFPLGGGAGGGAVPSLGVELCLLSAVT